MCLNESTCASGIGWQHLADWVSILAKPFAVITFHCVNLDGAKRLKQVKTSDELEQRRDFYKIRV